MSTALVIAILSLTIGAVIFVRMQRRLGKLKPSIIALQLTFSEASFRSILRSWGGDGVARFKSHFSLDYAFLVTYATLGFSFGTWLTSYIGTTSVLADLLPWLFPAAAVLDAAENLLHQKFSSAEPHSQAEALFVVSGLAASTKWLLILSFVPLAAIAALS